MEEESLWIDEAALKLGVSIRTIRHYENRGLVKTNRGDRRVRFLDSAAMARMSQILTLKEHGLTLAEIRDAIDQAKGQAPTLTREKMEDHLRLLRKQRAKLDRKIELMEAALATANTPSARV